MFISDFQFPFHSSLLLVIIIMIITYYFNSLFPGTKYSAKVYEEFPTYWFEGRNIKTQVTSSVYRNEVNTYKVKCGGSLEMWESSGWIHKQDPYGWFQW